MKASTWFTIMLASTLASTACTPCERTFCGCWEETVVSFEGTVIAAYGGNSISGIEVRCDDESEIRSTSDEAGLVFFEANTRTSPGCGIETCSTLVFTDAQDRYQSKRLDFFEADLVELELKKLKLL